MRNTATYLTNEAQTTRQSSNWPPTILERLMEQDADKVKRLYAERQAAANPVRHG